MEKSITITAILISFALGAGSMLFFLSPKIAQMKAEQIRIEAFSSCIEGKIMGVGNYEELIFQNVIDCYNLISR